MLHEALMLEIYRQALNAGALPNPRPRSTESANSSERCPSHDSNSSENGHNGNGSNVSTVSAPVGHSSLAAAHSATFPPVPQALPGHPPSMEAYLHMVAAAAQQYGFPLGAATGAPRLPLPLPSEIGTPFKLPPQTSPNASSNNSEALDFRTNVFGRAPSVEPDVSEEEEDDEETADCNNPLDLSVGTRKRSAEVDNEPESTASQVQLKKVFKNDSPPVNAPAPVATAPLMPTVNPYLAAVAAANIFRTGQFPDWNGKSDLVIDPLEKMSDIVKGPRKEKPTRVAAAIPPAVPSVPNPSTTLPPSTEGMSKARHNIWQSHWQNKGVASSVFRCVWCKQSFPTLDALTGHMKDSKHCGVNVPPFGNLPTADRHHQPHQMHSGQVQHSHNLRKSSAGGSTSSQQSNSPSAAAKNAFQYRGDPPTPLPRKLVRGQNVWLGKGVEQAMQILKCMRCGESFRSLGEMTKHMQETQHYTNILSQEQTISMKSSHDIKEGQSSMSSEESRTLSAVLTCKVCDKAFSSLGDLSNHMAKNNHYSEPLMQSMAGGVANRKRPAPKKREKSLPVRKLLEMKGAQCDGPDGMEMKMQRNFENSKRLSMEGPAIGSGAGPAASSDKTEAAMFAERMRQYISGVKSVDDTAKINMNTTTLLAKTKSPELEHKNGANKPNTTSGSGSTSVLSAIEQMFATSFDTPPRQTSAPAASPSNSSNKNTSPVASSILKRLGIDETVDYNKPLMDTTDPYYQQYRYTSSERSGSECSVDNHTEVRRPELPVNERQTEHIDVDQIRGADRDLPVKKEPGITKDPELGGGSTSVNAGMGTRVTQIKMEIKSEVYDDMGKSPESNLSKTPINANEFSMSNTNNGNNQETGTAPSKSSPSLVTIGPRSPVESLRSTTPKSPASSIKSYDGEKKYPSDSLNALSSMFDSLGSSASSTPTTNRPQPLPPPALAGKTDSPENLSTSNSLAALRQFCIKKEKTA